MLGSSVFERIGFVFPVCILAHRITFLRAEGGAEWAVWILYRLADPDITCPRETTIRDVSRSLPPLYSCILSGSWGLKNGDGRLLTQPHAARFAPESPVLYRNAPFLLEETWPSDEMPIL